MIEYKSYITPDGLNSVLLMEKTKYELNKYAIQQHTQGQKLLPENVILALNLECRASLDFIAFIENNPESLQSEKTDISFIGKILDTEKHYLKTLLKAEDYRLLEYPSEKIKILKTLYGSSEKFRLATLTEIERLRDNHSPQDSHKPVTNASELIKEFPPLNKILQLIPSANPQIQLIDRILDEEAQCLRKLLEAEHYRDLEDPHNNAYILKTLYYNSDRFRSAILYEMT